MTERIMYSERHTEYIKLETKASPPRQCSTGRMSGHSTKKDVNYYVNNYHA